MYQIAVFSMLLHVAREVPGGDDPVQRHRDVHQHRGRRAAHADRRHAQPALPALRQPHQRP